MIIKRAMLTGVTFIALAQTVTAAEPATLSADELDSITAGGEGIPTSVIIWDVIGGDFHDGDGGVDDDGVSAVGRLRVAF